MCAPKDLPQARTQGVRVRGPEDISRTNESMNNQTGDLLSFCPHREGVANVVVLFFLAFIPSFE